MADFTDLNAWKLAKDFRSKLMAVVNDMPKSEEFRLKDQIIRASRSITNNLAEGYGRFHFQENIQFCRISRGSLTEIKDHLIIALEQEYISEVQFQSLMKDYENCIKVMNGYINHLKKQKEIAN